MKKIDKKYFNNLEQYIPEGIYCYDKNGVCPFHDYDETLPYQENGYCHYLKRSDHDINSEGGKITDMKTGETFEVEYYPFGGMLWDECKECNIKTYTRWCLDCKHMSDLKEYTAFCQKHQKTIDVETDICDEFKPSEDFK